MRHSRLPSLGNSENPFPRPKRDLAAAALECRSRFAREIGEPDGDPLVRIGREVHPTDPALIAAGRFGQGGVVERLILKPDQRGGGKSACPACVLPESPSSQSGEPKPPTGRDPQRAVSCPEEQGSRAMPASLPQFVQTRRATGREPGARIVCLSGRGDRVPCGDPPAPSADTQPSCGLRRCNGAVGPRRRRAARLRRHRRLRAD
jgi:hypothetical protein